MDGAVEAAILESSPVEAIAGVSTIDAGWAGERCPLCDDQASGIGEMVLFGEYPTAQRDLLATFAAMSHPGIDLRAPLHRVCLERWEGRLQEAEMRCDGDDPYFIDLALGVTPILPTPMRMGADLRFTGRGVTIAFVDSGFYPHPDLLTPANRVIGMYDAVRGREIRDIGRLAATDPRIEAWHGTMAASTAAGSGVLSHGHYRGIASEARLVLVKVMTPRYRIRTPQVVRALEWILENYRRLDIRVVNLSLGVDETTDSMEHPVIALVEELVERGVVIVAASGNNPANPIKPPGSAPSAITVGGYNDNNSAEWMRRELWHSSYGDTPGGAHKPDLLAPAIWVAAPILPHTAVQAEAEALFHMACADARELPMMIDDLAALTAVGRQLLAARDEPLLARSIVLARIASEKLITAAYKHVDGTSFSAPIVSSIVAQMLEARPNLSPRQVKDILCSTAMLLANVPPEVQGHGLVAPDRALEATLSLVPEPAMML